MPAVYLDRAELTAPPASAAIYLDAAAVTAPNVTAALYLDHAELTAATVTSNIFQRVGDTWVPVVLYARNGALFTQIHPAGGDIIAPPPPEPLYPGTSTHPGPTTYPGG